MRALQLRDQGSPRTEQKAMYFASLLLVFSGFAHALVWFFDGGDWSGAVSWRKPILFGISAGVTVLSLGWLVGKMKRQRGDLLLLTTFSLAMMAEVGLITLQQWRGVPSHWNRSTSFDENILTWIELLVVFATVVIADLTRRSFRPLPTSSDMVVAIRGGMGLLLFSCLLGFVLVAYGNHRVSLGQSPEVYGAAGVMKFPHGVPMHALQFLPIMAWLLSRLGVAEHARTRAVAYGLCSLILFSFYSLLQTFSGRGRFEATWFSGVMLALSAVLFLVPLYAGLSRAIIEFAKPRRTASDPPSSLPPV